VVHPEAEGEDGLNGNVHGRGVEGLEHDLSNLFMIGLWVERSFSEEDSSSGATEFIVEIFSISSQLVTILFDWVFAVKIPRLD